MTAPLITWHQSHPGGRMVAMLGRIEVGVIDPQALWPNRQSWTWRFLLAGHEQGPTDGRVKSELAAKCAIEGHLHDWLRAAGLRQEERA